LLSNDFNLISFDGYRICNSTFIYSALPRLLFEIHLTIELKIPF